MRVTLAKLRKHTDKLEDYVFEQKLESMPDFVKHKEPQLIVQCHDLEDAMCEVRRLKQDNHRF